MPVNAQIHMLRYIHTNTQPYTLIRGNTLNMKCLTLDYTKCWFPVNVWFHSSNVNSRIFVLISSLRSACTVGETLSAESTATFLPARYISCKHASSKCQWQNTFKVEQNMICSITCTNLHSPQNIFTTCCADVNEIWTFKMVEQHILVIQALKGVMQRTYGHSRLKVDAETDNVMEVDFLQPPA